jgi:hypothetical protein
MTENQKNTPQSNVSWNHVAIMFALGVLTVIAFVALNR